MILFGIVRYTEIQEEMRESKSMKEQEEDIYYNFTSFVEAVEASEINNIEVTEIDMENGDENKKEKSVTLEDIVRFITGSKFVTHAMVGS